MAIKLNITTPADTTHLNGIIYGVSGAGKTHLLGTAEDCEETSPALLLDFENGTRTLAGRKIHIIRPQNWKEIQDIYEFLLYENKKYRSVLIDPVTEVQKRYSLGKIMGEITDEAGSAQTYSDLGRAEAPNRKDWNRTGDQMRKFIRAFRDLAYLPNKKRRVHVIFTALEAYKEKKELFTPSLIGSLGEDCGAMVDFLMRLSRQKVVRQDSDGGDIEVIKRHLLTDDYINEDGVQYMGKNRVNGMPKGIWEPTIEKIMAGMNGNTVVDDDDDDEIPDNYEESEEEIAPTEEEDE